jgi:hypothetical protein
MRLLDDPYITSSLGFQQEVVITLWLVLAENATYTIDPIGTSFI